MYRRPLFPESMITMSRRRGRQSLTAAGVLMALAILIVGAPSRAVALRTPTPIPQECSSDG